jgi:hypothetical protein
MKDDIQLPILFTKKNKKRYQHYGQNIMILSIGPTLKNKLGEWDKYLAPVGTKIQVIRRRNGKKTSVNLIGNGKKRSLKSDASRIFSDIRPYDYFYVVFRKPSAPKSSKGSSSRSGR